MDEYISKQRAKDLMGCCLASAKAEYKAAKDVFRKSRFGDYVLAMRTMIDVVDSVESADVQLVNRWISVEDRLPEYDKIVLVWYSYDGIWGKTAGYGISWYHGKWNINELNQTGDNLEVLYWMYAPEPPKDGDTE